MVKKIRLQEIPCMAFTFSPVVIFCCIIFFKVEFIWSKKVHNCLTTIQLFLLSIKEGNILIFLSRSLHL